MKEKWQDFESFLASNIRAFLNYKKGLRKTFLTEEHALRLLDRFLKERQLSSIEDITTDVLEEFLASRKRTRPRSYNHLIGVVRRLFAWMQLQGTITRTPTLPQTRRRGSERIPFIFKKHQATMLLEAAAQLRDSKRTKRRGQTYRMIFAMMYALGLRVGEVSRLQLKDVDLDRRYLVIRESKFAKTRLVPFGPNMAQALADFIDTLESRMIEQPLFSFDRHNQRTVNRHVIERTFRSLIKRLNFQPKPGEGYPRPHDLRHSLAVGTLLRWYQEGKTPADKLILLSTFLGHASVESTAVYLTITSDLLTQAGLRFELFACPSIEVGEE